MKYDFITSTQSEEQRFVQVGGDEGAEPQCAGGCGAPVGGGHGA